MALRPQDVLVVIKLAIQGETTWTYGALAHNLGMSPSEVHAAVRRSTHAGLLDPDGRRVNRKALLEFLIHGLRYVFAPERGGLTRGFVTGYAAPPLASRIAQGDDLPPVWPDPDGPVRGEAFSPLYRSAPRAAQRDLKLYECLALVDAIRGGRARERKLAEECLRSTLGAS